MDKNTVLFIIIAALGGFIGGFLLANSMNRSEINSLRTQSERSAPNIASNTPGSEEGDLRPEEIRAKIAEADKSPTDLAFQRDLGLALYRYAAVKQDVPLFSEAIRILERADSLKAKDFDVLTALGNAHFDIGYYKRDAASFEKARVVYAQALAVKPGDPDVQTDLGLTYFLQDPPAYDKAAAALQKVGETTPSHKRSLQFLVQVFVKQNKPADAERALERLKAIDAANPEIAQLTELVTNAKNGLSQ